MPPTPARTSQNCPWSCGFRAVQAVLALDLETLRKLGPLTVISNPGKPPGYSEDGPELNLTPWPLRGPAKLLEGPQM